jgi:hypothetical protein
MRLNLSVHQSTKVELVINRKTANALGITLPITVRAHDNEVIEQGAICCRAFFRSWPTGLLLPRPLSRRY